MTSHLFQKRASGILLHITSLPSSYGIGDIGPDSCNFIDFLNDAGQKFWQILPTNPTSLIFDNSPYMSVSAFAGSPLLISPDLLVISGLLDESEIVVPEGLSPYLSKYKTVTVFKERLLRLAFGRFSLSENDQFTEFCNRTTWLNDYALFMSLKQLFQGLPWYEWPEEFAKRSLDSLSRARTQHQNLYEYYRFEQFIFSNNYFIFHS